MECIQQDSGGGGVHRGPAKWMEGTEVGFLQQWRSQPGTPVWMRVAPGNDGRSTGGGG